MSQLQTDLFLTARQPRVESSDRRFVDVRVDKGDLVLVDDRHNLTQAIHNRLFTRLGELTAVGHPDYGSRLYELIGEPHNDRTRILAAYFVRECLDNEERIQEIVDIVVEPRSLDLEKRNQISITVVVQPIDATEPVVVPLMLNLGG